MADDDATTAEEGDRLVGLDRRLDELHGVIAELTTLLPRATGPTAGVPGRIADALRGIEDRLAAVERMGREQFELDQRLSLIDQTLASLVDPIKTLAPHLRDLADLAGWLGRIEERVQVLDERSSMDRLVDGVSMLLESAVETSSRVARVERALLGEPSPEGDTPEDRIVAALARVEARVAHVEERLDRLVRDAGGHAVPAGESGSAGTADEADIDAQLPAAGEAVAGDPTRSIDEGDDIAGSTGESDSDDGDDEAEAGGVIGAAEDDADANAGSGPIRSGDAGGDADPITTEEGGEDTDGAPGRGSDGPSATRKGGTGGEGPEGEGDGSAAPGQEEAVVRRDGFRRTEAEGTEDEDDRADGSPAPGHGDDVRGDELARSESEGADGEGPGEAGIATEAGEPDDEGNVGDEASAANDAPSTDADESTDVEAGAGTARKRKRWGRRGR